MQVIKENFGFLRCSSQPNGLMYSSPLRCRLALGIKASAFLALAWMWALPMWADRLFCLQTAWPSLDYQTLRLCNRSNQKNKTSANTRLWHFSIFLDSKNGQEHETVAFFQISRQKRAGTGDRYIFSSFKTEKTGRNTRLLHFFIFYDCFEAPRKAPGWP